MQQLLVGKRRLRHFQADAWKQVRIGDLLKEVRRPVSWSDSDSYHLLSVKRRSGGVFLREVRQGRDILTKAMKVAKAGDFLISKMQVLHGAMGLTLPEFDGMHVSGSYICLVPRDHNEIWMEFFDWLSRTKETYRKAFVNSYGVHIEKMTFDLGGFLDERIGVPDNLEEQKAIVEVLSTSEASVGALLRKRNALDREKRALMQQLLTGKRRVKV